MSDAILKKFEQHDLVFRNINSKLEQHDLEFRNINSNIAELKADVSRLDTSCHRMELLMEDNQKTQQLILENVVSLHRQIMPREDIEARFLSNENRISALEFSVSGSK